MADPTDELIFDMEISLASAQNEEQRSRIPLSAGKSVHAVCMEFLGVGFDLLFAFGS